MGDNARRVVFCHESRQNPHVITHIPQPSHEKVRLWTMSGVQAIQLQSCQGCGGTVDVCVEGGSGGQAGNEVGSVGKVGKAGKCWWGRV